MRGGITKLLHVCCEEEGWKTQKSLQLHVLMSRRLLPEVLIREELEFVTDTMYQQRLLGLAGGEELPTPCYFKPVWTDVLKESTP